MNKKLKLILGAAASAAAVSSAVAAVALSPAQVKKRNAKKYRLTELEKGSHGDRIYFLNTNSADAILIESNGKFALIDAAEDSDNPRGLPELDYEGTEDFVVECIKKIAGDENGKATLDFIVGTHSHSDHIGGFDTVLLDEDITVGRAYIKEYDASIINSYENEKWDNQEVYDQMMDACRRRGVPVIHDIPSASFMLGGLTVTFYNTEKKTVKNIGENENSLGVLIEKDGKRAFLAGDINNHLGDEDRLGGIIGTVDLLKPGHHGYGGSTSKVFAAALSPKIAVLTNTVKGINFEPLMALNRVGTAIYGTKEQKGVVAEFKNGEIILYNNIDGAVK